LPRKILLADDSVTAQNMGRKILADAGYEVVTVNNGSAALKRVSEIKPDLIVLDVYMPGYSGLEVCQRLKATEETKHVPVLLTVGKLEPFKTDEARRVGANAHIVKPFEASELLTAITRLEDCIAAAYADSAASGVEADAVRSYAEGSGGKWASSLGFSSKRKEKEEPGAVAGAFRDFRKAKKKAVAPVASPASKASAPEPTSPADIPPDITPEELDALSALVAKLDGAIPCPEAAVPPASKAAHQRVDEKIDEESHETSAQPVEMAAESITTAKPSPEILTAVP